MIFSDMETGVVPARTDSACLPAFSLFCKPPSTPYWGKIGVAFIEVGIRNPRPLPSGQYIPCAPSASAVS